MATLAPTTPQEDLLQQLEQLRPGELLAATNHLPPALSQWALDNACRLTTVSADHKDWSHLGRFDLAIVADYLEHLDKSEGLRRLALLRNLHSQRIWVLVSQAEHWAFADFIALGFRRRAVFGTDPQQPALVCYGYDLATYNHTRSWNNPRYWANPENWNKYRW